MPTSAFTGTLEECLEQLQRLPRENFRNLVEFTDAHTKTVSGWLFGEKKDGHWVQFSPAGEWWLKAVGFFLLSGWEVKASKEDGKYTELNPLAIEVIKLIAYGGVPIKEFLKKIGWSHANQLFRYLYGNSKTTEAHKMLMRMLIDEKSDEVDEREGELRKKYAITIGDAEEHNSVVAQHDPMQRLSELMQEILPLAKELFEDETEAGEARRAELRRTIGTQIYTEVTFLLNGLKSTTNHQHALQQMAGSKRGGK